MPEIVLPQIRYTSVGVVSACAQKSRKCPTLEARCCSDRAESAKTVRWVSLFDGADGRREVAVLPLPPHFEIKFKFLGTFWALGTKCAQKSNVPKSQMCPKAKSDQRDPGINYRSSAVHSGECSVSTGLDLFKFS